MATGETNGFQKETLKFLAQLEKNNNRDWFNANKPRYEDHVREPARGFIRAMGSRLANISPYIKADDRKVGGSLMRVYRDTRFGKDKTPYKTNIGIQFRHAVGRDVHAPGFYVHLEAKNAFLGVGVWRPDSTALYRIRAKIDEEQARWKKTIGAKSFTQIYHPGGESLKTAPKGFAKDHPLIDELRRKDFIAINEFKVDELLRPDAVSVVTKKFRAAASYAAFICEALDLDF